MMVRAKTAIFIAQTPRAHGVHEAPVESARELPVTVRSVGMQETYLAMSTNHNPEVVVVLEHDFDYQAEKVVQLDGVRYNVVRTYLNKWDQLEITLERGQIQNV